MKCKDLLNKFGGHDQAAGLGLDADKVDTLRDEVNKIADYNLTSEDMIENINVEFELSEDKVSLDLVDELHKLEPFGLSNPSPRFIMRNLVLDDIFTLGKNKQHLKLNVYNENTDELHKLEPFGLSNPSPRFIMRNLVLDDIFTLGKNKQHLKLNVYNENTYECIGFNMAHLKENFNPGDKVDILFQLDENNYMGNRTVQFLLKDMRLAHPKNAMKDKLSLKLFSKIVPNNENNLYTINSGDENLISTNSNGQHIIEGSKELNIFDYLVENTKIVPNNENNLYTINSGDENLISTNSNGQHIIEGSKELNIFDYLVENTLVIANTVNGFYRAISDISLLKDDFDVNYRENTVNSAKLQLIFSPNIDKIDVKRYNNIILYDYLYNSREDDFDVNYRENTVNSAKLQLIFSPNIDKIDVKRYNNIILYDYLYNSREYSYLSENTNSHCNIIKYYNEMDQLYLKNTINNIIPEREEFIVVYKLALVNKTFEFDMLDIKKIFNIMPIKLFAILNVFKELSLLDFNLDYNQNRISINLLEKPNKKLNLDESIILQNLKDLRQEYAKSY